MFVRWFSKRLGPLALVIPFITPGVSLASNPVPALFRQSIPAETPIDSIEPELELSIPVLEQTVYEQVNQHRTKLGLTPLRLDRRVSAQARSYSHAMAQRQLPFGHSDFRRRVLALNRIIPSRRISENVAYIFTHKDTAKRAVEGWIKSPHHRPILEGREYQITGIGIAQGERGAFYITQIYIRPRY